LGEECNLEDTKGNELLKAQQQQAMQQKQKMQMAM
jgi:hypothetical protein